MMYRTITSFVLLVICCGSTAATPVKLQSHSGDTTLPHKVLIEAVERAGLEYTHPYEKELDVSGTRILNDIKTGGLDVMWSMTTKQLEQDYQALYFPLFRGLLGMRLALVKAENRELFKDVQTLADLKAFVAGQGKTWPDTQILEANQLKVVKTLKYPNLFHMLEGERFDYYPRGLNEPWGEVTRFDALNLVVDPYILLKYRAPLYFFINKQNHQLQQKLQQSLSDMVADGSFNRLFFADEQVQSALNKANLHDRVIIAIDNPLLSENTPLDKPALWFDPLTDMQ